MSTRRVPKDLRVTSFSSVLYHRVTLVVDKGPSVVVAQLYTFATPCAGIKGDDRIDTVLAKARGVGRIGHGRPGECSIVHYTGFHHGKDGLIQLFPMQQVCTDSVSPVHVSPGPSVGIVLEEQMILAVVIQQSVGIVQPAALCREMYLGTTFFTVHAVLTSVCRGSKYFVQPCRAFARWRRAFDCQHECFTFI